MFTFYFYGSVIIENVYYSLCGYKCACVCLPWYMGRELVPSYSVRTRERTQVVKLGGKPAPLLCLFVF